MMAIQQTIENPQGEERPLVIWGTAPDTQGDHWCGEWREAREKRLLQS